MVIASLAFGIAVDDTVHCIDRLIERRGESGELNGAAVVDAMVKAGPAIVKTTIIISAGMLPFLLSEFLPSQRLGVSTAIVLALAVVGDLLFLPAILMDHSVDF